MLLSCCFHNGGDKKHKKKKDKKQSKSKRKESGLSHVDEVDKVEHIPDITSVSIKIENNCSQENLGSLSKENIDQQHSNHNSLHRQTVNSDHRSIDPVAPCVRTTNEQLPDPPDTPGYVKENERLVSSTAPDVKVGSISSISTALSPSTGNQEEKFKRIKQAELDELQKEKEFQKNLEEIRIHQEMMIQNLRDEHQRHLKEVIESFNQKFQEAKNIAEKENHEAIQKARTETDETIRKLNQQIASEKQKLFVEQQENAKNLEEEFKMKEERLNESLKQIQERDQAWQDERADILEEVQRLKAEATKMVKILAMEYEEDNLSEERKDILSQEVYSLQMVVEMRTKEVKSLRQQLDKVTKELTESEVIQEELKNKTEKMEDLEYQIKNKDTFERQLSIEKSQLEQNLSKSNRAAQRLSQNVEELQWRIRNNFDLPAEQLTSQDKESLQTESFKSFCASLLQSSEDNPCVSPYHSTPAKDPQEVAESRTVTDAGPQLLSNTAGDQKKMQDCDGPSQTGYFAPRSEAIIQLVIEEGTEDEEYLDDNNIDGDSLDEGLGDISSDETAESPLPNNDNIESGNAYENGTQSSQTRSHDSERRPSRISLETPL